MKQNSLRTWRLVQKQACFCTFLAKNASNCSNPENSRLFLTFFSPAVKNVKKALVAEKCKQRKFYFYITRNLSIHCMAGEAGNSIAWKIFKCDKSFLTAD